MSKTISALTEATTPASTDIFAMVVSGNSRKVALSSLFNLLGKSTMAAGTLAASSPLKLTQTWNDAGVTFTANETDITDTASASASLFLNFKLGGSTRFSVRKDGLLSGGAGTAYTISGSGTATFGANLLLTNGSALITVGSDTILTRDAAHVFAQRNAANAQTYRWYHTYTDASNYQRGSLKTAAGYVEVAAETAGTGADDLDVLLTPAGTGAVRFGTHSAIAAETVTGYITIKDAAGNARKVAVVS